MFYYLYKLLFGLYFIFVIVMYISCHSFPIKGTPPGEIDTFGSAAIGLCFNKVYTNIHFVTYIFIYIYEIIYFLSSLKC